jgi:hypothetical protein
MNQTALTSRILALARPLLLLLLALTALRAMALGPEWWTTQNVLTVGTPADEYAAINQGQLKNLVSGAVAAMDSSWPDEGAGYDLHELVHSWLTPTNQTDDYAAVTLGQLKAISVPVHDRLISVGLATAYPWNTSNSPAPDDYALANIGQSKALFAFDLNGTLTHHLPASWLALYPMSGTGTGPDDDFDGDGLSNYWEYLNGKDPRDFYNGQTPTLQLVSGGGQWGAPGEVLAQPITVSVNNGASNAPVTFTVSPGGALLSQNGNLPWNSHLSIRTSAVSDSNLVAAQAYGKLPATSSKVSTIMITAGKATLQTTATTYDTSVPMPTALQAVPTSPTTVQLSWTAGDATRATTIEISRDEGASWQLYEVAEPGVSTFQITGLTPDVKVFFRVITGDKRKTMMQGNASLGTWDWLKGYAGLWGAAWEWSENSLLPHEVIAPAPESLSQPTSSVQSTPIGGNGILFTGESKHKFVNISGRWSFTEPLDYYRNETWTKGGNTYTYTLTLNPDGIWTAGGSPSLPEGISSFPYQFQFTPVSHTVGTFQGYTVTRSSIVTEEDLDNNVISNFPPFTGNFDTENLSALYTKTISGNVLGYASLSKLQYKFRVNSKPGTLVVWDEAFYPQDNSGLQHELHSWTSNGETESPVYTLDPLLKHNGQPGFYDLSLIPVEVGSRDKYLGGSIDIPEGWETMEMEFVNKTSGENLGRYGNLDGSGATKIYNSVSEPLGEDEDTASESQPETQKVWFVRPSGGRTLQFYTCFNSTGEVEVRFYLKGVKIGTIQRTLTPATDFANTIKWVDDWVKGTNFDFQDPLPTPPTLAALGRQFAANASGGAPEPTPLANLTRAVLLPFFLFTAQVEGLTELVSGAAQGLYTGVKDDLQMIALLANGALTLVEQRIDAIKQEIHDWIKDPYKRARELKRIAMTIAEEAFLRPLREAGPVAKRFLGDPEAFIRQSISIWTQPNGTANRSWVFTKDIWTSLVHGLTDWAQDFSSRMLTGAEQSHWLGEPWGEDSIFADTQSTERVMLFTLGYDLGYIAEQVAIGHGLGVAGKAMVKGGITLAAELSSRTGFTVAAKSWAVKKLTTQVITAELREVLTKEITRAGSTALIEGQVEKTWAEIIKEGLERAGFDLELCNVEKFVEAACTKPNIKALMLQEGAESAFTQRLALFFHLMGDQVEAQMVNNFIRVLDERLIYTGTDGVVREWSADLFLALEGSPSRLVSRPVVTSLSDEAKAILKEVIDPAGSVWKSPPIGFGPRGLIAEAHLAYTEYKGFTWSPTRATVDFVEEGIEFVQGGTAVQLKTLSQNTSSSGLKTAISKLSKLNDNSIAQRILDIRKKPGLDTEALKNELIEFMDNNRDLVPNPVEIKINDYEFAPR